MQRSDLDYSNGFSSENAFTSSAGDAVYQDFAKNPTPTRMQLAGYKTHAYDNPSFAVPALDGTQDFFFKIPLSECRPRIMLVVMVEEEVVEVVMLLGSIISS